MRTDFNKVLPTIIPGSGAVLVWKDGDGYKVPIVAWVVTPKTGTVVPMCAVADFNALIEAGNYAIVHEDDSVLTPDGECYNSLNQFAAKLRQVGILKPEAA